MQQAIKGLTDLLNLFNKSDFNMKSLFTLFFSLSIGLISPPENMITDLKQYTSEHYADQSFDQFLYVSIKDQKMYLISDWAVQETYTISTATKGAGSLGGSNMTPTGLHRVAAKYGDELPEGAILKARQFTGKIATIYTDETDVEKDEVTTRILWLAGMEQGINKGKNSKGQKVDSYKRYIYIHGTPEEGLLGKPASHGCVRMTNADVIELYERVGKGIKVLILDR